MKTRVSFSIFRTNLFQFQKAHTKKQFNFSCAQIILYILHHKWILCTNKPVLIKKILDFWCIDINNYLICLKKDRNIFKGLKFTTRNTNSILNYVHRLFLNKSDVSCKLFVRYIGNNISLETTNLIKTHIYPFTICSRSLSFCSHWRVRTILSLSNFFDKHAWFLL